MPFYSTLAAPYNCRSDVIFVNPISGYIYVFYVRLNSIYYILGSDLDNLMLSAEYDTGIDRTDYFIQVAYDNINNRYFVRGDKVGIFSVNSDNTLSIIDAPHNPGLGTVANNTLFISLGKWFFIYFSPAKGGLSSNARPTASADWTLTGNTYGGSDGYGYTVIEISQTTVGFFYFGNGSVIQYSECDLSTMLWGGVKSSPYDTPTLAQGPLGTNGSYYNSRAILWNGKPTIACAIDAVTDYLGLISYDRDTDTWSSEVIKSAPFDGNIFPRNLALATNEAGTELYLWTNEYDNTEAGYIVKFYIKQDGAWSDKTNILINNGPLGRDSHVMCEKFGAGYYMSSADGPGGATGFQIESVGKTLFFIAVPLSGDAILDVSFTVTYEGTVTRYLWDFGDGATSTLESPTHSYRNSGTYSVTLTTWDAVWGETTLKKTDLITVTGKSYTVISADPTSGKAPLQVSFQLG